ncbi:MAG TPA: imidazole glycerol phosphate synthase cyclase subunit [Gaiellaceae bacterium]|nr:imidazole glycerol phosphate synthase cyclase subunit [Gaiellaceae bacterium]
MGGSDREIARNALNIRIIPRLDIKGPNLVKGIHFEGLRVLGKPQDFARRYYEHGADELIYMDVVASLYGRNSLLEIVERTSKEIFIPLTVGGGLRSVADIRRVLRAGADKVSINTAALAQPSLIREASRAFGSSTIVVSIEAIRRPDGTYEAYVDYGRQSTGVDAVEWAKQAAELGAGELLVTSIEREGTGKGFDLELTRKIAESVPIPVIAAGGAGRVSHVYEAVVEGRADAVSLASLLHYHYCKHNEYDECDFQKEGNVEHLRRKGGFGNVEEATLPETKEYLLARGIGCRWPAQACLSGAGTT